MESYGLVMAATQQRATMVSSSSTAAQEEHLVPEPSTFAPMSNMLTFSTDDQNQFQQHLQTN